MAALSSSAAAFRSRASELGLTDAHVQALVDRGLGTFGELAFATAYTPGQPDDQAFWPAATRRQQDVVSRHAETSPMPAESVVSRNAETLADSSRTPQAADSSGWYVVPMEVEPTVVETAAPVARPRGHVKCDQCGLVANHVRQTTGQSDASLGP